jgi:hypothetical protein
MHAGLIFRRVEDQLNLAALLLHGVVTLDRDLAEGIVIGGEAITEYGVVERVGYDGDSKQRQKADCEETFKEGFDARVQIRGPG